MKAQWRHQGRTAPGDTLQGLTPEYNKKMWQNLERTLDKRGRKVGVVTSGS